MSTRCADPPSGDGDRSSRSSSSSSSPCCSWGAVTVLRPGRWAARRLRETLDLSVPTQLWMNLTLAALIPASMIATRIAYGRPWAGSSR